MGWGKEVGITEEQEMVGGEKNRTEKGTKPDSRGGIRSTVLAAILKKCTRDC